MNRIKVYQNYILIEASPTDPAFARFLTSTEGVYKLRGRDKYACSYHMLPEVLEALRNINERSQVPDSLLPFYDAEIAHRQNTRFLIENGPQDPVWEHGLWQHQQLGVEIARYNRRYNFFYDTRTGKTRMAYQIMLEALREGRVKRCLVVAPATIIKSWLEDAKCFPELKVAAYYKDGQQQDEALHTPCHVMLWSAGMFATRLELLKRCNFDLVFFDESSKIKNYKSEIAKAALDLSEHVPYWYNLSATPAPNGEHEYYIQMRTVDPYCFAPARTHFVSKYFDNFSRNNNYEKLVIKPFMREDFKTVIQAYSLYVDQSVMPTAGKEWFVERFELTPAVREYYDTMRSDACIEIEDVELTVDQAAALRAKLQQITSGFALDSDAIKRNKMSRKLGDDEWSQEVYIVDKEQHKLDVLQDILFRHRDEQAVIWANYRQEFADIQRRLGPSAVCINGSTSINDRELAIERFQKHQLKYLICHPKSIGMGVKLTAAHIAVYYSMTDSWEDLKQSSERIFGHIDVQPNKCLYYVMEAVDTTNGLVYDNVTHKRDASTGLLEHLKAVSR